MAAHVCQEPQLVRRARKAHMPRLSHVMSMLPLLRHAYAGGQCKGAGGHGILPRHTRRTLGTTRPSQTSGAGAPDNALDGPPVNNCVWHHLCITCASLLDNCRITFVTASLLNHFMTTVESTAGTLLQLLCLPEGASRHLPISLTRFCSFFACRRGPLDTRSTATTRQAPRAKLDTRYDGEPPRDAAPRLPRPALSDRSALWGSKSSGLAQTTSFYPRCTHNTRSRAS